MKKVLGLSVVFVVAQVAHAADIDAAGKKEWPPLFVRHAMAQTA